jgi:hypothetical protein
MLGHHNAWHKAQCDIILAEMRLPPPATLALPQAPNPPEAPNGAAPTAGHDDDVEETTNI